MKNISTDDIRKLLKEIKYPGFSKDIVSFGMVKDVIAKMNSVKITLQINSDNEEHLSQLRDKINRKLNDNGLTEVNIHIYKPIKKTPNIENGQNTISQQLIPGVKHIIAVASGQGGVGKSTIAVNLAAALSKESQVGLLDLDIYGPSLPMLVGINEKPEMTEDKKLIPIEKYNMRLMSFGFINSQNAPTIWRGPMVARMTQQFFDDVEWGNLDFLVLDLPPGTGDIQLTLVQKLALTGAIIVTTPQDLALMDVKKSADMFVKVNTPVLGVIENMTHFLCPHCNETTKIFPGKGGKEESDRLGVPLLGSIYLNPEIANSTEKGLPFVLEYEDSPITNEYYGIVSQIHSIIGVST